MTDNTRLEASLSLAIIVPVLDEFEQLSKLVAQLNKHQAEQIIIVDGGSTDGSVEWLQQNWVSTNQHLISCAAGRARQMNLGASYANQDVLLFLHADTQLPLEVKQIVCRTQFPEHHWGRFDVAFDTPSLAMNVIAFFMNWRSRITRVATGDQAMFMHHHMFDRVGGFDDIALMEDVAMSKKLKAIAKPVCSKKKVITSTRRWEKNGLIRTVVKMWCYRFAYFVGVSPTRLARGYRNVR